MNPHISVITIGVSDLSRAKQFYSDGLGWPVAVDQGQFVSFAPADGSSGLALYPMQALPAMRASTRRAAGSAASPSTTSSGATTASTPSWPMPSVQAPRS